jgi:hypothetical protein
MATRNFMVKVFFNNIRDTRFTVRPATRGNGNVNCLVLTQDGLQ